MALGVEIHQKHPTVAPSKTGRQIDGRCGLPAAPFLINDCNRAHRHLPSLSVENPVLRRKQDTRWMITAFDHLVAEKYYDA
jgi:hypothetical protein